VQVGPLANVLAMVAAGHEPTQAPSEPGAGHRQCGRRTPIPVAALHSTIGRIAARAVRCAVLLESLQNQWQLLIDNIAKGDFDTFNRPVFPKGEIRGFGYHEAPRGVLSHWAVIENGKIKNYQAVVPSTWNAGPRDDADAWGLMKPRCWTIRSPIPNCRWRCCGRCIPSIRVWPARSIWSIPERRPIVQVKAFG
jgi:hydrogenase large subunit